MTKKRRNFGGFFQKISIVNISASEPNIEKLRKPFDDVGYHHFKTIRLFLSAAVAEKTAAEKPKKIEISRMEIFQIIIR